MKRTLVLAAYAALSVACGGGGSDPGATPAPERDERTEAPDVDAVRSSDVEESPEVRQDTVEGPTTAATDEPRAGAASGATYYVYVGAESADLMHRISWGPDGASVDRTTEVGELPVETEGPHGLMRSPDGQYIYMTTGHGLPDGKLWKFHAGPDTLVGEPTSLGRFPATLDLTPDGLYAFVANLNLHGEHVPSSVSVVYTPEMMEVVRIETCVMPHGARTDPQGVHVYSACMMDDQIVEVDTRTFEVSRRFSVAAGQETPLEARPARPLVEDSLPEAPELEPTCSPTWTEPSADGRRVFVACNGADVVLEIDGASWSVTRRFETGRGPYNLAVSPDGRLLVATLKQGGAVQFFELESGAPVSTAPSSTSVAHGVVVSPDSRYAFVSVEGVGVEPGKVDIFDLRSFERVADVEVGQQAGGIVFWRMDEGR
jgi:DNA-binding beta-propeller fold protein YncE